MSDIDFEAQRKLNIQSLSRDHDLKRKAWDWAVQASLDHQYTYNFSWLGLPIIQFPQDVLAMQELFWNVKPDLIIETGIARGGSLAFWSSMLSLLDIADGLDPQTSPRRVLGIDIDIRPHNLKSIQQHPFHFKMKLIEGSSVSLDVIEKVQRYSAGYKTIMVCLDSNHTHTHVLAELEAYAPLVSRESYCIVFDTAIEDLPPGSCDDRPWDIGDNPKTAVHQWLRMNPNFSIDSEIEAKLLISVAPDGFLRRVD